MASFSLVGERFCRICRKTFCCKKCRDHHTDKVHPDLNTDCLLCCSEVLPMRQFEFKKLLLEDKKLLCHIADKHLPLHCILCGNLYQTEEDLKFLSACAWHSQRHQFFTYENLSLPGTPALTNFKVNLKRCISDNVFFTPPEIYRNTSTPMFASQKSLPNFGLKTPKAESSILTQDNPICKINESQVNDDDSKFFSFISHNSKKEEITPIRSNNSAQFPKSNTGKKMNIKEEPDDITNNETEQIASYTDDVTSPIDMDLTDVKGGLLQEGNPKQNVTHEESSKTSDVKKVRFSEEYNIVPKIENSGTESCTKSILNLTEEDVFYDARVALNNTTVQSYNSTKDTNAKDTKKDAKEEKNTKDTEYAMHKENMKIVKNMEDIKVLEDNQVQNQKYCAKISPDTSLEESQIMIFQDNEKNMEKENRKAKTPSNDLSVVNQQDTSTSKVLMMMLLENNSGKLSTDLMPLISSGLKKFEEQVASMSSVLVRLPNTIKPNCTRRSITKMEMNISCVENYLSNVKVTNHRQIVPASPSSLRSNENTNNGGILSAVTQAVKYAFRNLSSMAMNTSERIQEIQRGETVKEVVTSLSRSSTFGVSSNHNPEIRPGKRTRDITEMSSRTDPIMFSRDVRSPAAKRQRGWYTTIKGRQPIQRMRNNKNEVKSSRGVSLETQIFSQGSLTVGDTVLPLPARAHQSTQTE